MSAKITPPQRQRIFGLLNQLEETAWRDEYAYEASAGRTTSIGELSTDEAHYCISQLGQVQQLVKQPANPQSALQSAFKAKNEGANFAPEKSVGSVIEPAEMPLADKTNQARKKILSYCHTMGWYKTNEAGEYILNKYDKPQLDYERIDAYCLKYSPCHKKLNDHSLAELTGRGALVYQFSQLKNNSVYKK